MCTQTQQAFLKLCCFFGVVLFSTWVCGAVVKKNTTDSCFQLRHPQTLCYMADKMDFFGCRFGDHFAEHGRERVGRW